MNNKILLGSIVAVVILVLVSFTGVVGYQTTKSSTIARASPLFNVRSKRAIDKESKDLTCDYVGKGEESVLSIPRRDDRLELSQKLIDIIVKMDDKTFDNFIGLITNRLQQKYQMSSKTIREIVTSLGQLRNKHNMPENLKMLRNIEYKDRYATEYCNTAGSCFTTTPDLGCFLFVIGIFILTFFLFSLW